MTLEDQLSRKRFISIVFKTNFIYLTVGNKKEEEEVTFV